MTKKFPDDYVGPDLRCCDECGVIYDASFEKHDCIYQ